MRYYLAYINKNKEVPLSPDAPFSNFLGTPKRLKFLPGVFKRYEMGYRKDIEQPDFAGLHHTAATALNSICLHGHNFPWARRIYKVFRFLKKVQYRITKNEAAKKTVKRLISDL
jgi:hypothetical protein